MTKITGKWQKSIPKTNGYYWVRYRRKGGKKTLTVLTFVCRHSDIYSVRRSKSFNIKESTKYSFYLYGNQSYHYSTRLREYIKGDSIDCKYLIQFDLIQWFNQPVNFVPDLDKKDLPK